MAKVISFTRLKDGEVITFSANTDTNARQAQIAAFINSSDLGPNSDRGQDFTWRLSPEIVVEVNSIKRDPKILTEISRNIGLYIEDIQIQHIINYLIEKYDAEAAAEQGLEDDNLPFEGQYKAQIEAIEKSKKKVAGPSATSLEKPIEKPIAQSAPEVKKVAEVEPKISAPKKK